VARTNRATSRNVSVARELDSPYHRPHVVVGAEEAKSDLGHGKRTGWRQVIGVDTVARKRLESCGKVECLPPP